jgi:hypothetical protein
VVVALRILIMKASEKAAWIESTRMFRLSLKVWHKDLKVSLSEAYVAMLRHYEADIGFPLLDASNIALSALYALALATL